MERFNSWSAAPGAPDGPSRPSWLRTVPWAFRRMGAEQWWVTGFFHWGTYCTTDPLTGATRSLRFQWLVFGVLYRIHLAISWNFTGFAAPPRYENISLGLAFYHLALVKHLRTVGHLQKWYQLLRNISQNKKNLEFGMVTLLKGNTIKRASNTQAMRKKKHRLIPDAANVAMEPAMSLK